MQWSAKGAKSWGQRIFYVRRVGSHDQQIHCLAPWKEIPLANVGLNHVLITASKVESGVPIVIKIEVCCLPQ